MSSSIQFDAHGRVRYHPEFHPNHGKPWTTTEQRYFIENYARVGPEEISLALGRTIHSVMQKASDLRRLGLMPKPKRRSYSKRHIRRGLC